MTTTTPAVSIRPVDTVAEYRACQELQRRAWGITEDGYVVPIATLISVQHAGGLVLGAFVRDRPRIEGQGIRSPSIGGRGEQLAGFAFAYLGKVGGRWALYSQLAAVDESLRDLGLGERLKQAQRTWAREQGLELVAWSFDPLQAGNANFNLHRLGASCRAYHVNYFGERSDALNAGLDSDRLLAEWPVLDTPRLWHGKNTEALELVVGSPPRCGWDEVGPEVAPSGRPLRIEIPAAIGALRDHDRGRAQAWQAAVREAFLKAFAGGYVAMDVQREDVEDGGKRIFYLLRRPAESSLPRAPGEGGG